jgi:hypothetical protein
MSDGTDSGTEEIDTGGVTVPESARVLLPDDAIKDSAGNLGAAEWPAGEAGEPHGESAVAESQPDAGTAVAGTPSAEDERLRAERATDDGEVTPSDPSQPIEQATPPANLAEPLR